MSLHSHTFKLTLFGGGELGVSNAEEGNLDAGRTVISLLEQLLSDGS